MNKLITNCKGNFCIKNSFLRVIAFVIITLQLSITSVFGQSFAIVGTGATGNATTTYPSGFANYYWGARHQFFVTAAQLTAAGMTANSFINSVGFNVITDNGTTVHTGYTVKVYTTTSTNPLTAWVTTGLVSTSTASNINPVVGWNQITVPDFLWNGTVNLVIETCFNNSSFTTNAVTAWTAAGLGTGTWSRWFRADATGVCANTGVTGTSTTTRPNMRFGWNSCLSPSGLNVTNNTSGTSATINWVAPTPAPSGGYQYYVSTSATAPTGATLPTGSTGAGVVTANLTGLTQGTVYYFWVKSNCGVNQPWISGGSFTTPSSCAAPTGLNVTNNTTGTSATLNWTAATSVPAGGYDYYFSTSATAPTGATIPSGNTALLTANITGLLSQTTYYYWVRSNCGATQGLWIAGTSFITPCSGNPLGGTAAISSAVGCASTAFNLSATGISSGAGITYQWQSSPTGAAPWSNIAGATAATYATSTTTTTYYRLRTTCSSTGLSGTSSVVSYSVNSCAGSITMSDSFGDGWNGATMQLWVNGSLFQTFGGSFTTGTSQTINFCLPSASTYALVYTNSGGFPTEVGVTSFIINGTNVYSVGAGGAVVSTTLVSGTACPPPCSGTPNAGTAAISSIGGCASTAFNLSATGISAGSGITYQWQSASSSTGPWTNITGATASTYATSAVTTTYYQLITTCTTSGLSNTSSVVSYSVNSCAGSITMSDSFGDGWNGATMSLFVNGSLFQTFGSSFTTGTSQTINFCLPSASTYALVYNTAGSFPGEVGVTSLIINGTNVYSVGAGLATVGSTLVSGTACPPPCSGTPNAGTASISVASGCANVPLTFTATGTTAAPGITYQWQSGTSATGPWTNISGATTIAYNLPGGVSATTYFQLVTTCSSGPATNTSNVISYNVNLSGLCSCGAYPNTFASSTIDEDITNVTVGSLNNTSNCSAAAPGPGSILNRYGNYTGSVAAPSFQQGSSVPFSITQSYCPFAFAYNNIIQIYIDYNQNGSFADAGEQVYSQAASVANNIAAGNFTVPAGATLGTTRMRVVVVQNGTPGFNYAQNAYTWGETEDYCVTIIPFVPCSGAPNAGTAAISSSVGCIGSNFNLSSSGISSGLDITYQWQSASSASGPWTAVTNATNTALSTSVSTTTYFQLVSTCTVSGLTASTSVVSYSTLPAGGCQCASHCIPTYGSACSSADFINNVSTTGAITNISNLNSGCSGAANNYSLYLNASLTASIGTTFTISVQSGTSWAQGFAVWIDYNQNNTFDASEYVYSNASSTTLNSGAITIPTTALTGSTRMRVRCAYVTTPLSTDACTNFSFGETEDYCITLVCGNPTLAVSASPTLICIGSTASLNVSGSDTYTWNPGALTGSVVSVSPSSSTIYTVTGVNNNGCSNTATLSLTVDNPTVTAISSPTAICVNGIATLTAGGASTYTWEPGTIVASSPTVSPASTTIYTVTGTSINGCSSTNTINIVVNNLPIIAASVSPTAICIGSSATLSGSGANTYTWSPGASLVGASATVSPSSFTNYTLTGTDANGCVNTNTVDLIVNSLPTISASSNPLLLCYGSTATLSASGANTYTWNPGNLIGSPVNDAPLTTTIYTVNATDINGCNNTATLTLVVSTTVTASASPTAICLGGSSTLSGGNAVSYTWDPGNLSGTSITVSPTTLTNYTVTGTDANGCISSNTLNVNVNSLPVLNPVATPAAICIGSNASLTVNGATTYTWQPGGPLIGTPQTVSPTTTTQYTVTGTDANGCVNSNTVNLVVNQLPTVTINTSTNNVCYGSAVALSAGGAITYTWNPGSSNSSLISVTPLANTVYSVTGTDNNGCNNTSTISIAVSTTVTASASPSLICSGSNATLIGNNAVSYSWNPGAISGNNVVVNPVSTTNYTVTATDVNGCVSSTTVNVTTDQTPTITPVANPAIICSGGIVNLSATGAVSYTWNPGSLVGSSVNDSPGSSTIYSVTGASTAGCLAASAQTVLVTVGGTATATVNYYEGFEGIVYNNQLPNCSWSSTSPGSACKTYTVSDPATNRVPSSGNNFACFQAPTAPGGDYFFSNAVQLTAGAVYSMTLKYVASPGSNWTKFGVMYNNTQSPRGGGLGSQNSLMAATTITVINSGFNSSLPHADVGATFSVPTTGFYYIAVFAEGTTGFLSFDDNNATMYSNLPIDLVSYTATKYSDVVKLDWRTQSELNSEKFIIEKSIDAVKWDFVSETKAAGKSTTIQDYTTYDNNPYNGISYYRLLQQDFDKTMHNYGIRTVNFSRDRVSEIMLMPNPTSGSVNFDYYSQYKGSLSFKVNDVAGKVVITETNVGELSDGKKSGTIYLNEFKPGVYFVEFNCNNLKTVKKIIRQ